MLQILWQINHSVRKKTVHLKKRHTVLHLYLQVLPEIAVSAVVWIDNHLLQDNLRVYHHDTNRMLASLDGGRRSGN